MTNHQINIAIAEECGWTDCEHVEALGLCKGKHENVLPQYFFGYSQLPDYCNDLNAMHEAEMTLPLVPLGRGRKHWDNSRAEFRSYLRLISDYCGSIHATARQRAEAFLRTIGKWEESE
jgi:hypothetical protein